MQRPIMDPTFLEPAPPSGRRWWVDALVATARFLSWCARSLLSQPFARGAAAIRSGEARARLLRGLAFRLLLLPPLLALAIITLVWTGTHPVSAAAGSDPAWLGLYYERARFQSEDGMPLQGWLVPAVDARRVVDERNRVLRPRPAVVLAHDFGRSPEQMLPLLAPLHREGFVVLAVGLRGAELGRPAGQTFGLRESMDVAGAIQMLRAGSGVDAARLGVVGVGTGANAAILAASRDQSLAAVVAGAPAPGPQSLARRIGPQNHASRWLQPLCVRGFELMYGVDAEQLQANYLATVAASRPTLLITGNAEEEDYFNPRAVEQICAFLRSKLGAS